MSAGFIAAETLTFPRRRTVSPNIWLVAVTVTLATFMELLDTSIANVALPHTRLPVMPVGPQLVLRRAQR